jgi:hypothetical protein
MRQRVFHLGGTAVSKACIVTAVLNSVIAIGHGQTPLRDEEAPVDFTERALRYGPFDVRPSLKAGVVYDDNIFISSSDEESDFVWNITPGLMLGSGDYVGEQANFLTLFYAPSFILFTDNTDEDAVDHDARMRAVLMEGPWKVTLDQRFQALSGAQVDVGDRVDRNVYATHLALQYEISPKTTLEVTGRQLINDYDRLSDFNEWNAGVAADYAITPKVKLGLGVVGGWLDVDGSANQTYQQVLLRASYTLTEKVMATGAIGAEFRQFQGDEDNRTSGVFDLGVTYRPWVNTAVRVEGYRRNQNSVVLADQNYTATGFSAGVRQMFRDKYAVSLAGGYENADYDATSTSVNANREDNYFLVRVGFDWTVIDRLTFGAFYQYRQNDSNTPFEFTNNQVGLAAAYQF